MPITTQILQTDAAGVAAAADILARGGLVAMPTETVYGLGGDARDGQAVARIYQAKGRPSFNPLIAHVASVEAAQKLTVWGPEAEALGQAFWPGPLTMVLPLRPDAGLSSLVTAGLETVAVRVPAHPVAQQILHSFGAPVAAPSANPSGRLSPTSAAHVMTGLNGQIDAVVDGGDCAVGVESTIVGLAAKAPQLLRPGGVAQDQIEAVLGKALEAHSPGDNVTAPGQLESHYAPGATVRLNAQERQTGEVLLGFGAVEADMNLSPTGDLIEAAANLFSYVHALDALAPAGIAVSPIPETGLGQAINDRLRRAAAPRPNGTMNQNQ